MIFLGADHAGFELKEAIKKFLEEKGLSFEDLGAKSLDPADDYPDYAEPVAKKVAENPEQNRGILICGSGAGVEIVANKVKGIRAALSFSADHAQSVRNDDDVNVLALAARFVLKEGALKIVEAFLETPFAGLDRFKRRLEKIAEIEERETPS